MEREIEELMDLLVEIDQPKDQQSSLLPEVQRPDCPDTKMSERHRPVEHIIPIPRRTNDSTTSREACESDQTKEVTTDFQKRQSSPLGEPISSDEASESESDQSESEQSATPRRWGSEESITSSVSFKSDGSKDIIILFKDDQSSLLSLF